MSTIQTIEGGLAERRDLALEEAFRSATDSFISSPNILQRALYPVLLTEDIGLLVETGPAAGRLEAAFVPTMSGSRDGTQLQRLFVIASDDSLLDDYLYRLAPYLRSLAVEKEQPFTLFVDGDVSVCRQYLPGGNHIDDVCDHPLDAGIDVVVASFSRFRSLFFGAGGVHAMPGALEGQEPGVADFAERRRDLFYFDEAQSYDPEAFSGFVKLVEFLYAEDMDVLIGTSTLPQYLRDELSFLERLDIGDANYQPPRKIKYIPGAGESFRTLACAQVKSNYLQNSRVGVVFESPQSADACYQDLVDLYPQAVYCYHSGLPKDVRLFRYSQIRELEKEGEGYLLITEGKAIANSNIDVNLLITGVCAPEALVRRAGRCNRRGDLTNGNILVIGAEGYTGRRLQELKANSYFEALNKVVVETDFLPKDWIETAI